MKIGETKINNPRQPVILRTVKSKELSQKELKKDEKSIRSKQKTMTSLKDKIQEMAGDTDVTDVSFISAYL